MRVKDKTTCCFPKRKAETKRRNTDVKSERREEVDATSFDRGKFHSLLKAAVLSRESSCEPLTMEATLVCAYLCVPPNVSLSSDTKGRGFEGESEIVESFARESSC